MTPKRSQLRAALRNHLPFGWGAQSADLVSCHRGAKGLRTPIAVASIVSGAGACWYLQYVDGFGAIAAVTAVASALSSINSPVIDTGSMAALESRGLVGAKQSRSDVVVPVVLVLGRARSAHTGLLLWNRDRSRVHRTVDIECGARLVGGSQRLRSDQPSTGGGWVHSSLDLPA